MPNIQSRKKELRQNQKRKQRNLIKKSALKKLVKKVKVLVSEKKKEEVQKMIPQIYKTIDKTAKAGIIKKNTAARKKSRLTKLINK